MKVAFMNFETNVMDIISRMYDGKRFRFLDLRLSTAKLGRILFGILVKYL